MPENREKFSFPDPIDVRLDDFDPDAFAKWLREAYEKSPFKTITQLAETVESNKATLSRLMTGAPQTLTGRPSKPRMDLILRLAKVLKVNETEGLHYGGHPVYGRPYKKPENLAEFLEQLEFMGFEQFDFAIDETKFADFTADDFEELRERIAADVNLVIRRKRK